MASETEDLELESLRSAVLASLKPKTQPNEVTKPVTDAEDSTKAKEDEDEEESLRLLRLAALKSKKEDSVSHVSTPVPGSPAHPQNPPAQENLLQPQPAPFHQAGPGGRSNLITIPLQDTTAPLQTAPGSNSNQAPKTSANDSGIKEERSTKFSRFESSDSESDVDEDIFVQTASDSDKSAISASESDKDSDSDSDSWRTRSFSEAETSSSEAEADKDRKSPEKESVTNKNHDSSDIAEKDVTAQKETIKSDRPEKKSERETRKDNVRDSRDNDRSHRDRRETRHLDLRSQLRSKERSRERERNHQKDTRDKRDDYRSRDSEREKRIEERRRHYESRRGDRRPSPGKSQRHTSDRPRREDRLHKDIDRNALEARRQKFASGSSVNLKDKKVVLKSSENGANIPVNKSSINDNDVHVPEKKSQDDAKAEKLPTEGIESDISLSSVESEAESESESSSDEEDKKESESESESGSDEEDTRFKRTLSDTKTSSQAPTQSRLIISMTFPKEGPPPLLPRRRANDIDRSRDRRGLDDLQRSRRPQGFRDDRKERDRRDRYPRDQQEHGSSRESRDRVRVGTREERRHPRDTKERPDEKDFDNLRKPRTNDINERERDIKKIPRDNDINERAPPLRTPRDANNDEKRSRLGVRDNGKNLNKRIPHAERETRRNPRDTNLGDKADRHILQDNRTLSRKIASAKDFVSESSESESETVNQALRSIVKTDKAEEDSKSSSKDSKRSKDIEKDELKERRDPKRDGGTRERERKSKHKRDVKERIGRRKRDVIKQISDGEAAKLDSFKVTISEDTAAQKKRSVLDRLGSAPPADKVRNSVKSRLGPVKTEAADSTTDIAPIDPEEDLFPEELGPQGDGVKRRKVEINDKYSNPTKKRLKLKRVEPPGEVKYDDISLDHESDMYTVAEPPAKRKQLSKSLLSRLSDKPGTPLNSEEASTTLDGGSSPEIEPIQRKVKSRDSEDRVEKKSKSKNRDMWSRKNADAAVEDVDGMDDAPPKRDIRKSKNKDIWSSERSVITANPEKDVDEDLPVRKERRSRDVWSSKRKAVTKDAKEDSKGSKDDELEERIRMIKAKNAAIMQRQKEIEEEKKMFGGHR
ncbi:zinc finger CCCH domain-containing protein 13-like [Lytechinus pictus]|uniref:zinc finger CCCH domain-containing protein 13-like n=1 Tax=Lytechinus pictus TaxID=7653 RepID=UPI0030B9EC92